MEVIILALVATVIGFFVIALNRRAPTYLPARGGGHPDLGEDADYLGGLSEDQFSELCLRLIKHMDLDVESVDWVENRQLEIRAQDPKPVVGGLYVLLGVMCAPGELVTPPEISNLYSVVKDEDAIKGILVTNGLFAAPAAQMMEADRLELINGAALLEMVGRSQGSTH